MQEGAGREARSTRAAGIVRGLRPDKPTPEHHGREFAKVRAERRWREMGRQGRGGKASMPSMRKGPSGSGRRAARAVVRRRDAGRRCGGDASSQERWGL